MTVTRPPRSLAISGAVTVIGAVLAIAGTLLPWEHVEATLAAANNVSSAPLGVDYDDGKIFIFVAILTILASGCAIAGKWLPEVLVMQVGRLLGGGPALSALTGGYIASFSVLNLHDMNARVDALNGLVAGTASVGIGIYVDVAAGFVIVAGAAIGLLIRHDQPPTSVSDASPTVGD